MIKYKKAQLTQGLRATAPSFQDGRQPPFGYYQTGVAYNKYSPEFVHPSTY